MENLVTENNSSLSVPVLVIAYRRIETTQRVLAAIRQARPRHLYVACNAPRPDRPAEAEQCSAVRQLFDDLDWPSTVHRLYRDVHLSARDSISSAITWFFENVESGIILEDDCVPTLSFFHFCQELLERYKNDRRVGMISGNNFQFGRQRGNASYYFTRYCHIWGWATWRDRWLTNYDTKMSRWPAVGKQVLATVRSPIERLYWSKIFSMTYAGRIDTWDYQWLFSSWMNGRINIVPQKNLVTNIGFGNDAHNTRNITRAANMSVAELDFPLTHPECFIADADADRFTFRDSYLPTPAMLIRGLRKRR